MSVEDLRQRREEARAVGMCPACFVAKPVPGRKICNSCNTRAKERVIRMRRRRTEQRGVAVNIRTCEAAGDAAIDRYAYIEAAADFEKALEIVREAQHRDAHNFEDEARLTRKIGLTLFYGARPEFAEPWFERALQICKAGARGKENPALTERIQELQSRLEVQAWLRCQTPKAVEIAFQIIETIDKNNDPGLFQHHMLRIANFLVELGRCDEAATYIASNLVEYDGESLTIRSDNVHSSALVKAAQGRAVEAFEDFERAANIAKQILDGYGVTGIWGDYANAAMALGRLDLARACRAKALLVAQERRILWRIPFFTLRFAATLIVAGDYEHARDLVSDVLTYDTGTPTIRILRAAVGTELALALNDTSFLRRVFDEQALVLAVSSEEPARFAPLAASYAKVYIQRKEISRARRLIGNTMEKINYADHVGDLLALAARYGTTRDAAKARELLIARTELPHASVAKAFLAVWEMNDALRYHDVQKASAKRDEAIERFGRLGWKHYKNQLQAPGKRTAASESPSNDTSILSDLRYTLSAREQEVAVLVLRGLTNRMIGQTLHITEHTVETHMTSILNRLGLRSRWQLHEVSSDNS